MGRWALVQCNCSPRTPLNHSRWGAYSCGHKDGAILAFAPNDLLAYGQDLQRIYRSDPDIFTVWRKIGDWHNYADEYLCLSCDEAQMWQLEIEQLQQYLSGHAFMRWPELKLWERLREEERRLYSRRGYEPTATEEVLADGLALCQASSEFGKEIEFFW